MKRSVRFIASAATLLGILAGFLFPERMSIPLEGASRADWNPRSFLHSGWGPSGVHKGIDIFAPEGTQVLSSTPGFVLYAGSYGLGGTVIVLLGPKWRIHYYAHLRSVEVRPGILVARGVKIATVGTTGDAAGKAPHLHYSILTPFPYPWLATAGPHGWKRMFFLDPGKRLPRT